MLPVFFQPVCQHIGQQHAHLLGIDRRTGACRCYVHGASSEQLASMQQFAVDLADLVQDRARAPIVGQVFRYLLGCLLWHVIHLRPLPRVAYGQVVLGAVSTPLGAFASGFAARLVSFDQSTAQDRWHRRQLTHQRVASFAK